MTAFPQTVDYHAYLPHSHTSNSEFKYIKVSIGYNTWISSRVISVHTVHIFTYISSDRQTLLTLRTPLSNVVMQVSGTISRAGLCRWTEAQPSIKALAYNNLGSRLFAIAHPGLLVCISTQSMQFLMDSCSCEIKFVQLKCWFCIHIRKRLPRNTIQYNTIKCSSAQSTKTWPTVHYNVSEYMG